MRQSGGGGRWLGGILNLSFEKCLAAVESDGWVVFFCFLTVKEELCVCKES